MSTSTTPNLWQIVSDCGRRWWVDSPAAASQALGRGWQVRLVDLVEAAYALVLWQLTVPPWVIRQGIRKAWGTKGRALVCICLRRYGLGEREIAQAMEMAPSSVHELMETYWNDREIVKCVQRWDDARSETLLHHFLHAREQAPEALP